MDSVRSNNNDYLMIMIGYNDLIKSQELQFLFEATASTFSPFLVQVFGNEFQLSATKELCPSFIHNFANDQMRT